MNQISYRIPKKEVGCQKKCMEIGYIISMKNIVCTDIGGVP